MKKKKKIIKKNVADLFMIGKYSELASKKDMFTKPHPEAFLKKFVHVATSKEYMLWVIKVKDISGLEEIFKYSFKSGLIISFNKKFKGIGGEIIIYDDKVGEKKVEKKKYKR